MVTFFWQRGFYFDRRMRFFDHLTLRDLRLLQHLSLHFINLFIKRLEVGSFGRAESRRLGFRLQSNISTHALSQLSDQERFVFNVLLATHLPMLLNLALQLKINILFFYYTRTFRGIALKLGRPLKRKTRARTYFKPFMTKPPGLFKLRTSTSAWF